RRLERKAPAFLALGLGAVAGLLARAGRQSGQAGLVGEDELEGVGGVQDVLAELGGQLGELDLDFLQPLLADGVELSAGTAEVAQCFVEEASAYALEPLGFLGRGEALELLP